MKCTNCRHENPPGQKFCGECGGRLEAVCPSCQASNPPGQKFCGECGAALAGKPAPVGVAPARPDRFASPESYTPKHLAEKILTSRGAIEGERKQRHGHVLGRVGLHGHVGEARPRGSPRDHGPGLRGHPGRGATATRARSTSSSVTGSWRSSGRRSPTRTTPSARSAPRSRSRTGSSRSPARCERTHGIEFRMRMGINTGPVVVGRHRPRPAHGLHGGGRHDQPRGSDSSAIAQPGQIVVEPAHAAPPVTGSSSSRTSAISGQGQDRARSRATP